MKQEKLPHLQNGILLGDAQSISEETLENLKTSSIYHILAVSGTHVGIIIIGLTTFLKKIKVSKQKINVISCIFLILFMFITGFTPSVIRAAIMAGLGILANILHRKNNILNSLCFALLMTLIYNPYNITNISVLLSYGGVIRNNIFLRIYNKIT